MAHKKKCPYCHGYHYRQRAYNRCKAKHKRETWGK
jgi:hypothetical protein